MSNFEFNKKIINLRICNKTYQIEDNKNLIEKLISFGEEMKSKADNITLENNSYTYYEKIINELSNDCYKFIDSLLGPDSSKDIFKNRMYDIEDCFSLLNFIKSEIEVQRNQRMSKYSSERIQRKPQDFKKKK